MGERARDKKRTKEVCMADTRVLWWNKALQRVATERKKEPPPKKKKKKNNSRKEKKTRTVLLSFFIPATGTHAQATYGTKRETEKKRGNELQQESQVRAITLS